MFPLRDARGRVLGFGARAMRDGQQPKYVNSPETAVYRKGRSLFGIDLARQHATRAGRGDRRRGLHGRDRPAPGAASSNVVASMGTALTDEQVAELARLARVGAAGLRRRPLRAGGDAARAARRCRAAASISR